MAIADIVLPVTFKSDARGLRKAEGELKNFGKNIGKVIAGATATVAGIGIASVKSFATFDDAMTKSLAIMGDVSDSMREEMSDAAREVAKTTTFSAEQAAESFFFLASAGLDAEQQLAALPAVANFAQAGMFDMSTATDLLTDAQSALGMSSDDAAENLENMINLSDMLVTANTSANATVEEFASSLTNKAAVAMGQFGTEIEEGLGLLAVFADSGIKGERAGTLLSSTLLGLAGSAEKNADAFADHGIAVFDAEGNTRDMVDIVRDLEGATEGMSDQQRGALMTQLGFNKLSREGIGLLMGNSDALEDYTASMGDAGGKTDEVANKQLESFSAQMALLQSALVDVGIEIGGDLIPLLAALVEDMKPLIEEATPALTDMFLGLIPVLMDLVDGFPDFVDALIPLIPIMGDIAGVVAEAALVLFPIFLEILQLLLPVFDFLAEALRENTTMITAVVGSIAGLIILGTGIANLITLFSAFRTVMAALRITTILQTVATGAATIAQRLFNIALKANPIGLVITAIALLVGALVWFFTQTETGQKMFAKFMDFLKNSMEAAGRFFKQGWDAIVRLFSASIDGIVTFFRNLPGQILAVLRGATTWLAKTGRDIVQGLKNGIDAIWRNVSSFFSNLPNAIRGLLGGAGSWLRGIGRSAIDGLLNGLKSAFRNVTRWVSGAADRISGGFKRILGISSPSKVFLEHGLDIGRGLELGLAKSQPSVMAEVGGLVSVGGLSTSGLGFSDNVAPSPSSTRSVGGDVYNIHVTGGMMDPEGVAREVVRVLNNSQRRSGSGASRLVA